MKPGAHNHFGTDVVDPLTGKPNYSENGKPMTSLPADFYSSDAFADRLIGQLRASSGGQPSARRGEIANTLLHVSDITPTVLELAGVSEANSTPAGLAPLRPITGLSWAAWLRGEAAQVRGAGDALGTELFGSRALRQGDWKITDIGDGRWRLFNLAADPGETRDLAAADPAKLAQLARLWNAYAKANNVVIPTEARYRP